MQVKLLRAIQEKKVRKVGQHRQKRRSTCASSRQLTGCSRSAWIAGTFRQDLYYRAQRHRTQDATITRAPTRMWQPLVEALLVRLCGPQPPRLDLQAMTVLEAYSFPGNVRELENILERATALCNDNTVVLDDLQLAPATWWSTTAPRQGGRNA
jgi:two-component system response regulator PilR (NtrC family)